MYSISIKSICYIVPCNYIGGVKVQTITIVVFKPDIYAVNSVNCTQFYLPPNRSVTKTSSNTNWFCFHACSCVSINCPTSVVDVVVMWLGGNFVVGYIIYRHTDLKNNFKKYAERSYILCLIKSRHYQNLFYIDKSTIKCHPLGEFCMV